MINTEELNISNKSYINKDFQSLYPEILSLAKKLSARWDPQSSNESDPGVVLLKLLGFMGDKLNYNSDKNTLECFMPSATQESSMRNLCEASGYSPKYYRSATTNVSFMYTGSKLKGTSDAIALKAFDTVVVDVDNSIKYTLVKDCRLTERYKSVSALAMEGTCVSLSVGGSNVIHLENLDDNNRIYFPEKMVAENGVFILNEGADSGDEHWKAVTNLNTVEPGSYVYKFGYDSSRGLPYVEFPDDIANLIESGLSIRYFRTLGVSGNIRSGFLTTLSSPGNLYLEGDSSVQVYPDTTEGGETVEGTVLVISNLSATSNGSNPESIDEAYNSFKKVVGTFDTLVTCRDYANAIYNLVSDEGHDVVSNVQVADRRTDINYSNNVVTFTNQGVTKVSNTQNTTITPFDLCLYPLNPITTSYTIDTYNKSFRPLKDLSDIEAGIESKKTISHTYKNDTTSLKNDDVYLYKNYYTLNAQLTTSYKVNAYEQKSILENVNKALYEAFNARKVDYGYEIDYDLIYEAILGADARIKNVSMPEPEQHTVVMTYDGNERPLYNLSSGDSFDISAYTKLAAKNILAGRMSLFDYDTRFNFEFGQTPTLFTPVGESSGQFLHDKIVKMTPEAKMAVSSLKTGYELGENEVIQAIAPSLVTEVIFPAYVNYRWDGNDIADETEHKLAGTDVLYINRTDSNDKDILTIYTATGIKTYSVSDNVIIEDSKSVHVATLVGQEYILTDGAENIFKPSGLDLKPWAEYSTTNRRSTTKWIKVEGVTLGFYSLGTSEEIQKRKRVKSTLTSSSLPCYWITNNPDNALFTDNDKIYDGDDNFLGYQIVLGENEYFIYSNTALTELEVLGSGTRLTLNCVEEEDLSVWKIASDEKIEIEDISQNGLAAFSQFNWKYKNFTDTPTTAGEKNLTIEEMTILTLVEGDSIRFVAGSSPATFTGYITNDWRDLPDGYEIEYTVGGETETLPSYSSTNWKLRSRLDINAGPELRQKLKTTDACEQSLTLSLLDSYTTDSAGNIVSVVTKDVKLTQTEFVFNTLIQCGGEKDIDTSVTYLDGTVGYDVCAYSFNYEAPSYVEIVSGGERTVTLERELSGYLQLGCRNLKKTSGDYAVIDLKTPVEYTSSSPASKTELIMFFWEKPVGSTATVSLALPSGMYAKAYNTSSSWTDSQYDLHAGINVVQIYGASGTIGLKIKVDDKSNDYLQISKIKVTSGYNKALNGEILTDARIEASDGLLNLLRESGTRDGVDLFYYNNDIDAYSAIESSDLSDPLSMFDSNNLANKFTLCQIDFSNSSIEIVRTSKL